jgi:sec-independent protein translocase protein TatB
VFNLQGSELVIILLLALVVLGPEKLPDAMRKMGQFYGELRKMSNSFQKEFKAAVDEPMREVRDTANMLRDSADFRKLQTGERGEKPKSAEMVSPADPAGAPTSDVPFDPVTAAPGTAAAANGEAALETPSTLTPPTAGTSIVPPPAVAEVPAAPTVAPPTALPGPVDGWVARSSAALRVPPPPTPPAPPPAPAEETAT